MGLSGGLYRLFGGGRCHTKYQSGTILDEQHKITDKTSEDETNVRDEVRGSTGVKLNRLHDLIGSEGYTRMISATMQGRWCWG
jgi:hypothetical protein